MGGSVSKESITVHSCHPFPLGQGPVDEAHKWLWAYYEGLKEMMVYSPSPESAEIEQAAMLTLLEEVCCPNICPAPTELHQPPCSDSQALHDWGRLDDQAANTAHAAMAYSQALDALATAVKRTLEVREEVSPVHGGSVEGWVWKVEARALVGSRRACGCLAKAPRMGSYSARTSSS
jgi:hypothetical protein